MADTSSGLTDAGASSQIAPRPPFTFDAAQSLPTAPEFTGLSEDDKAKTIDTAIADVHAQAMQEDGYDFDTFGKWADQLRGKTLRGPVTKFAADVGSGLVNMAKDLGSIPAAAVPNVLHPVEMTKTTADALATNALEWLQTPVDVGERYLKSSTRELYKKADSTIEEIKSGKIPFNDPDKMAEWAKKKEAELLPLQEKHQGKDNATQNGITSQHNAELIGNYIATRNPVYLEQLKRSLTTSGVKLNIEKHKEEIAQSKGAKAFEDVYGKGASQHLIAGYDPMNAAFAGRAASTVAGVSKGVKAAKFAGEMTAFGVAGALRANPDASVKDLAEESLKMALMGGAIHGVTALAKAGYKKLKTETPTTQTDATQTGQIEQGNIAKHPRNDEGGPPAETGGSGNNAQVGPPPTQVTPPVEPAGTSIKNAANEAAKARTGRPAGYMPGERPHDVVNAEAEAIVRNNPAELDNTVAYFAKNRDKTHTDTEVALLEMATESREKAYVDSAKAFSENPNDPKAKSDFEVAQARWDEVTSVNDTTGAAWGRAGARRREQIWDSGSMLAIAQAKNGGKPLSPVEIKTITEQAETIKKGKEAAQQEIADRETAESKAAAVSAIDAIMEALKKEAKAKKTESRASKVKRMTDFLDAQAEAARQRLRQGGTLSATIDPLGLTQYAIIGASYIAKGVIKVADFGAKLIEEFGEAIRPHIDDIFKAASAMHDATAQQFLSRKSAERPTPADIKTKAGSQSGEIDPKIAKQLKDSHIAQAIESGKEPTEAGITTVVQADLQELYPHLTVTDRMARDAYSDYGKVKFPSQEPEAVAGREIRRLAQLQSALEDAEKGLAAAKTGQQRDKASARVREATEKLKAAMRENGINQPTSPEQLASRRDAIKTRLENQIEDLQAIIDGKRKIKPPKERQAYDAELEKLAERRDALQKIVNELPEQQAARDLAWNERDTRAFEASEAEWKRRATEKQWFNPKTREPKYTRTARTQSAKDAADAARQAFYDQRRQDEGYSLEVFGKSLVSRIDALRNKLAGKQRTPKGKIDESKLSVADKASLAELRALQAAWKAQNPRQGSADRSTLQKLGDAYKSAKAAIGRVEKQIDELKRGIDSRNARPDAATAPGLNDLQNTLADLRRHRDALRNDLKPQKSPEVRRVKSWLAAQQRRTLAYREAIREGRELPKKTPVEIEQTEAVQRAKLAGTKAKEDYLKANFERQLANMQGLEKAWDFTKQVIHTSRDVLTSVDLSAVARQGGILVASHPMRSAKSIKPMFEAFGSEVAEHKINEAIKANPDYPMAMQAGLAIRDQGSPSISKTEELYRSRWGKKIPLVAGSARAYVTFLNKLRMDAFSDMAKTLSKTGEVTPAEAKIIANYINVATGVGDVSAGRLAGVFETLNLAFFAPRLVLSRFQYLTFQPLRKGMIDRSASWRVKRMIGKEYARYVAGMGITLGVSAAALSALGVAYKIDKDPRSTTFGNIIIGNTHIDLFAGLKQAAVFMARMITGETLNQKGQVQPLRGPHVPFKGRTEVDVMRDFVRSKLNPVWGSLLSLKTGSGFMGEQYGMKQFARDMAIPMSLRESAQNFTDPATGVVSAFLTTFGVSVNTYDPNAKKTQQKPVGPYKPWFPPLLPVR